VIVRRRVLIVDDERVLAEAMRELLSDDHDVEVATTTAQAIGMIRADGGYEVVLCDVLLADGTALDVLAAYRAAWPGRERRLAFVTGGGDHAAIRDAVASGRHRLLKKPFDLDELPALIEAIAGG
jgi:DNA-binding NtrC family response regulator